jgi:hypothetical protein
MRLLLVIVVGGMLAGCSALAPGFSAASNLGVPAQLMRGTLAMSPDQKFTYVAAANAFDDVAPAAEHENIRRQVIAAHLAQGKHCPSGYEIDKKVEERGQISYEGHCK